MIFTSIMHDKREKQAFVMTKADVTVLTILGSNRKASADEQAVRFVVRDGQAIVWATDTTHVVWVEPDGGSSSPPRWPDINIKITARSLKTNGPKKASQTLAVLTTGEVLLIEEGGNATPVSVETPGPCDLGWAHLTSVRKTINSEPPLGGRWPLDSRAIELMAAMAKACAGEVLGLACPPYKPDGAFLFRVRGDLDGARWNLATMPMQGGA